MLKVSISKQFFNVLFFHFWSSFFSSMFIIYSILNIFLIFGTTEWAILNFVINLYINSNYAYSNFFIFFIFFIFFFALVIKLGLPPVFFFKLEIYKGLPFFLLFLYSTFFFFFFFIVFFFIIFNFLFFFFSYFSFFIFIFSFIFIICFSHQMFKINNINNFFAISSVINSIFFFFLIFSFNI